MNSVDEQLHLIEILRELHASSPTEKSAVRDWYERARSLENLLMNAELAVSNDDYHFLWHYVADADIRSRSPEYREAQQRRVSEILDQLASSIPSSRHS